MTFAVRLEAIRRGSHDPHSLSELARQALAEGEEADALPLVEQGAQRWNHALLWQWSGLLHRAIDEHEQALGCFQRAARLAPSDPSIAHGFARTALEAGVDSVALFERARALAPSDGEVLVGLAAARLAVGDGVRAAAELDAMLAQVPMWIAGHQQLAQLRSLLGERDQATASLERALAAEPASQPLWDTLFGLHLRAENYAALQRDVERARKAGVQAAGLKLYEAICAGELDDREHPPALFSEAPPGSDPTLNIWRIRHLLRVGGVEEAAAIVERELETERARYIWPYASLAWRRLGDPRIEWLEGDPSFVGVFDLEPALPPLDRVAALLRSLHVARAEYLDQSVRGGTQTDGSLLTRIEPEIRALRAAIVDAVAKHVAGLPAHDPKHPLLGPRRDRRIRFAGSWSVRLRSGGRHSNHVHPAGWISSALYIALPSATDAEPADAGWLTLGGPQAPLGPGIPPFRSVEPKPGRLVLFPSYMWHGTVPFAEGERLTVAFDVAPPR